MSLGLLGRKVGMMRIFTDDGDSIPVTVIDVSDNRVTQIKTPETDGYAAVQVTFGQRRASRVGKPLAGQPLAPIITPRPSAAAFTPRPRSSTVNDGGCEQPVSKRPPRSYSPARR